MSSAKDGRVLLGMLTPSSNTALEPLTSAIVSQLPEVSAHFGRFRVTEISLTPRALGQFDTTAIIEAAKLLADAQVDVIAWSGTSSGWLGFDTDEALCRRITEVTGIPACTSVLACNELMQRTNRKRFGLVSPYLTEVQRRIEDNYTRNGYECVAERHLGEHVNFAFSNVTPEHIKRLVHEVATAGVQSILTYCTNLRAAHVVQELEDELGIPVFDTVSTAVWKSLRLCGVDTRRVRGWGSLFEQAD